MADVEIAVLGSFSVRIGQVTIADSAWPSRRAAELVQLLAITDGHRLLREQAIEALWPHLEPDAGAANLRKAAHHARQALGDADAVVLRHGSVLLFPDRAVVVDAEEFERLAASGDPTACDAYGGELLPGSAYEEWMQTHRQRLAALHLDALRAAGRWEEVVALDPLDEAAHRSLMRAALDLGGRAAALRWYGRLRGALATELGVSPSAETQAIYAECIADVGLPAPDLVGRDQELAALDRLLSRDIEGSTGVVLRGPAGIGKTALCREFATRATAAGAAVLHVEPADILTPYGVLHPIVEALATEDLLAVLADHTRAVLGALAPSTGPAPPTNGPMSRHQVIGAVRRLLLAATTDRPIVIVADDVHDMDHASTEALLHLASRRDAIGLVLALRGEPSRPALDQQLGRLVRAHRLAVVEVGPLDADHTAALARSVAEPPLTLEASHRIASLAGGNPFATIELARHSDSNGEQLPVDAGKAITHRLVDLPEAEIVALRRLALVGDEFDTNAVVAFTGGSEITAFALLDRALDAGVLVVAAERYRFRHDLVRRALADQVPPHERLAVHRDAARRLAAAGASPAQIARHWLAGGRPLEAVDPLLEVAAQAMQLGAFPVALEALGEILAAVPGHPLGLRLRAEALEALGDVGTVPAYDAAIVSVDDEVLVHDLRAKRALAQLKQGDAPGAVRSLDGVRPTSVDARLAEALTFSGAAALGFIPPDVGTAKAAECRRLALEAGDAGAIVVASWAGAAAAHARGELRDSVLADLRDTSALPHLATRVFDGQLCVTQRLLYGARPYDDVIAFADALVAEAQRLGAARGHAFGTVLRGEAALLAGRLDDAESDLTRARDLHRSIGGTTGEAHSLQRLAELALCRGDHAGASALLDEALDLARATDMGFHLLDRIYGTRLTLANAAGDPSGLLEDAEASVQGALETCPGCRITFAVPAAIAAADAGDLSKAREHAEAVAFLASVVMRLPAWTAAHHEVLAHLHRAEGDDEAARSEMRLAANGFAAAGQPLDELRCRCASAPAR